MRRSSILPRSVSAPRTAGIQEGNRRSLSRQTSQDKNNSSPKENKENRKTTSQNEARRTPSQNEARRTPSQNDNRRINQNEAQRTPSSNQRRISQNKDDIRRTPSKSKLERDRSASRNKELSRRTPSRNSSTPSDRGTPTKDKDRRTPSDKDRRTPSDKERERSTSDLSKNENKKPLTEPLLLYSERENLTDIPVNENREPEPLFNQPLLFPVGETSTSSFFTETESDNLLKGATNNLQDYCPSPTQNTGERTTNFD